MGRFDESATNDYAGQAKSPAAPKGLRQDATAAAGVVSGDQRFADSATGQFVVDHGYVPAAQSWYTGASNESPVNGWNTGFVEAFMAGQDKAAEDGNMNTYFEDGGTGIVTWDHTGSNGEDYRFGDIVEEGKKTGNVYDQFKDQPGTADLMMSDWVLDATTKARVYKETTVNEDGSIESPDLAAKIQEVREQNNVDIPKQLEALQFGAEVEDRSDEIQGEGFTEKVAAGGALGGAALGAGAGAAAGAGFLGIGALPGALIGGAIGAIAGGIGAAANEDTLADQAARASVITEMSGQQHSDLAQFATAVQQWGQFASSAINPVGNLYKGIVDASVGEVGDGTSEMYATDKEGRQKIPTWVKVGDVAASVADMGLQFASPIGAGLYLTQMNAVIGGEVGELALTGGESFDLRTGGFDNIFTDDQGDFSPTQAAAGIGKIGIDVVQMSMARGLLGKVQAGRAAAGEELVGGSSKFGQWLYGGSRSEKEASGWKFKTNAEGKTVARPTLSILAPSEQLSALSASVLGRRAAKLREPGSYSADDFYKAAKAMSDGQNMWTTALVNGMGEGYEEAWQAVLEPYSHQGTVSMEDIGTAAVYGFAGGVGMGLGTGYRGVSADAKLYGQARLSQFFTNRGTPLTKTEWKSMSDVQKRSMAAMSNMEKAVGQAAVQKIANDQSATRVGGVAAVAKLQDAIASQLSQNLARGKDNTDQQFVITQLEAAGEVDDEGNLLPGSLPSDSVASSGRQLAMNFVNRIRGVNAQVGYLEKDLERAVALAAADPQNTDAAQAVVEAQQKLNRVNLVLQWAETLSNDIETHVTRMYQPGQTPATVEAEAEILNRKLRAAFNMADPGIPAFATMTDEDKHALSRAITHVVSRYPQDQSGSYQVLVPQVSAKLTSANSDHVLEVSHAVLPALTADYDGDKVTMLEQLMLDDEAFISARAGTAFLGSGVSVNVGTPKYEVWTMEYMGFAHKGNNGALHNFAAGTLTRIADSIRNRYDGVIADDIIEEVLDDFMVKARAGSKDARKTLLDGFAEKAGKQITVFARGNMRNEWLWMDQVIKANMDTFQQGYAAHNPDLGPPPDTDVVAPNQQSDAVRTRKAAGAAVTGINLALETVGDTLFRKFQKLHYSSYTAAVLTADEASEVMGLLEQNQLYEALSQAITQSELDNVRGKDAITSRAYVMLQRLSLEAQKANPGLSQVEAMVVMANLAVHDLNVDADGNVTAGAAPITLAQLLLKREIQYDRRKNDAIFDASPELQARHAKLNAMTRPPTQGVKHSSPVNAERAFIELLGSQQLYTLLGDAAMVFGPHLTPEQFIRAYVSKSETDRRGIDAQLRHEAEYLGRKSSKNIPYRLDEVVDGEISAYRSVVDAIIAVGHNRITMDAKGNLKGEHAQRSDDTSDTFQQAITDIQQALREYEAMSPRQDGESTADLANRLMQLRPDFAAAVYALIPNASVNAVIWQTSDGHTVVSDWVFDMLTMEKAEAEMHYFRNMLIAEWSALGVGSHLDEDEDNPALNARKFSRLPRRMHRIMYLLNPEIRGDQGQMYRLFIEKLEMSKSVEEFMRWVNLTPGVRGDQAPLTAWVDDVSEFDQDKAKGGWSSSLQGAELREAVSQLQSRATLLIKDLASERASIEADVLVEQAIERVIKWDEGDRSIVLLQGDREYYNQTEARLREAKELAVGLGPQAMVWQSIGAAMQFYASAHTKGKNPPNVELAGQFDAQRDAYDYVLNYERVMASLTTLNIKAVGSNMSQLAKDGVRMMDDEGRLIEHGEMTVKDFLGLMRNPDTRAMARAMVFPQVMERDFDGALRPKLLVGKSLKGLLSSDAHKDLFPDGDKLSQDKALRYVSMVEAQAREHGGHFSVQRAVNDIVIAKLSAAEHTLSSYEVESLVIRAYHDAAKLLQKTASVAAVPGSHRLDDFYKAAKKAARATQTRPGRRKKRGYEDPDEVEVTLEGMILLREAEAEIDKQILLDMMDTATDEAERSRMADRLSLIDADVARFAELVKLAQEDDLSRAVVQMFTIPKGVGIGPAVEDLAGDVADAQRNLIRYVQTHLSMLERSSSALLVLKKVTDQLQDSGHQGQVHLEPAEWDLLERAVIAVYIDDVMSSTGAGVSVPPYPDADHESNERYYDTSFSYLMQPFFDKSSPMLKAAAAVHKRAGRQEYTATDDDLSQVLSGTVFKEFSLGDWTSDIPRGSAEANQRLDSAAAGPAIAMAGNSPKRQAVISAATRRTFMLPVDPALFSTTSLTWNELYFDPYDEVEVTHATGTVMRPIAQMNNRFADSVILKFSDGAGGTRDYDLLAEDPELGRPFMGNAVAAASGLMEIHMDRLQAAVERAADKLHVPVLGTSVDIHFLHPDMQPAHGDWSNNLFFEGTAFKYDADTFGSLNAALFFSPGGLNQEGQRNALDASKLGQSALQVIKTPTAEERALAENGWRTDFLGMLRVKTKIMMQKDLGFGELQPEFYNAVHKNLKLRHFVRGTIDGEVVLWSAEQVIEAQRKGEALPDGAELWIPSDDVLRSMLGEPGNQGVDRILSNDLDIDLNHVDIYRGVTPEMVAWFSKGVAGQTVALGETRLAAQARQSMLSVRARMDNPMRNAYDARINYRNSILEGITNDRANIQRLPEGQGGFNPNRNLAQVLQAGSEALQSENIAMDFTAMGIPYIASRIKSNTDLSKMLLAELTAVMKTDNTKTGWIFREGEQSDLPQGIMSNVSINGNQRNGLTVAPGDLVLVELQWFTGDNKMETAKKRIDWLMNRGAVVILGDGTGQADMRDELGRYMLDSIYSKVAGSPHVYQPSDQDERYANQRARTSSLVEMRGVSKRSMIANFLVLDQAIEEGASWVNAGPEGNERLSSIGVVLNLLPVDFLGGFNAPVSGLSSTSQIEIVRQQVMSMDTPQGRAHLRFLQSDPKWSKEKRDKADKEFDVSWKNLMTRLKDNPGTVMPQAGDDFGTGDFIPLVDGFGNTMLYRHGYKAPLRTEVEVMTATNYKGQETGPRMAIFPAIAETSATTHIGKVVNTKPRNGFGMSIELNIDLQLFGDKKVLEWNGMKYLLTPKPDSVVFPNHGFFKEWGVDLISSAHDMMSKESFEGLVNNHRNAFAYFGIDFTQDIAKFLNIDKGEVEGFLQNYQRRARRISIETADELMNMEGQVSSFLDNMLAFDSGLDNTAWIDRLTDERDTVEGKVMMAMLIYLATPGAMYTDILRSGGFNDNSQGLDGQSRLMPRLFTQVFDNAPLGSTLRTEINERLNQQIHNPNKDGTGYRLHQNFTFEVRNTDPKKNMRGFLQFAEAHSAGDNPVKNGQSFDDSGRGNVSMHAAATAYQSTGGITAFSYDPAKARNFAQGVGLTKFAKDLEDGGVWRMLTGIPAKDATLPKRFRSRTPAEMERANAGSDAVIQYRQELHPSDDNGWGKPGDTANGINRYHELRMQIIETYNLKPSQVVLVDYWVRQLLGMPAGAGARSEYQEVTGKAAIGAAQDILAMAMAGYLPLVSGEVSLLHVHDLSAIYRANKDLADGWAPKEALAQGDGKTATTWQSWVEVALGSAFTSDNLFDPLYLLSMDGFMHTYQNATDSLFDMPISMDSEITLMLLDPEVNNRLLSSMDPNTDRLARDPMVLDATALSMDNFLYGDRVAGKYQAAAAPADVIQQRREERRKWHKEKGVPVVVPISKKNLRKNGFQFVDKGTNTNALARALIDMRVGMALFNPALYASMGPEQWVRGTLDRGANLLTGQSTAGLTALAAAHLRASRYTPDQIRKLGRLTTATGKRSDFKGEIYKDLMYLRPTEMGSGAIGRFFERFAKIGSRMQDPTHGMSAKTLARRYNEAALSHILATPTLHNLDVDSFIAEATTNPMFLRDRYPDAHLAGINSIAQIRSLKATPLSLMLKSIYEPLSESNHGGLNFFGNVVLKMPLLFSGYAMNVVTTITGMQGVSDMFAAAHEGRKKGPNSFFGRIQAALRGEAFDEKRDAEYDMSSVLEGIDLTRSFIRGGMTHSGLFMFGMLAGGLGLSGEDDEAKKRRRMAELQGAGFVYDPRKIENDFRNSDAIFLDWLPFGFDTYFKVTPGPDGRSMAQLHWTLKQFISPIMGMEKFFETGDFNQVMWGFQDAVGSFPLINTLMWDDAVSTAHEFADMAASEDKLGGPQNMLATSAFLANAVGVYERMLFENAFVNDLYTSFDKYDRNPYALPQRDSDGTIQRDIENEPYAQDLALKSFIDPETGEVVRGYESRDRASGALHALTENRATLAFAANMFSGLTGVDNADYFRRQQVVKTREMQKPKVTREAAEAYIRAAMGRKGLPNLTASEIRGALIQRNIAAGVFQDPSVLDAEAAKIAAEQGVAPMSVIDEKGREVLTKDGARGIMQGLYKGSVTLADASLKGVYISYEMRQEIVNDWTKELVQEGVDMGLDQSKATTRMKRLMYGEFGTDQDGLADMLMKKPEDGGLSYAPDVRYNQLNTTYVMGPDGRPWATGFTRDGLMGALGLKPLKRAYISEQIGTTGNDERLNTTDLVNGMNTGLRALELVDETRYIPTDVEIGKAIEEAIKNAAASEYTPFKPYSSHGSGYGGYTPYKHRRYSHGGYGGYGGGSGYFTKMYGTPHGTNTYANTIPFINTSNPLLRRADIRRERVWSERGRLKQWQ